jgi:hypothetical protein
MVTTPSQAADPKRQVPTSTNMASLMERFIDTKVNLKNDSEMEQLADTFAKKWEPQQTFSKGQTEKKKKVHAKSKLAQVVGASDEYAQEDKNEGDKH